MKVKVVVSKEAQLASLLYRSHIINLDPLFFQFLDFKLAKLVYTFRSKCLEGKGKEFLLGILDKKIKVDYKIEWFEEIKEELIELKNKFEGFYNEKIEEALEIIKETFLIKKFPNEVEVYLVYNLSPTISFGSALVYKDRYIIFQSAGKNERRSVEEKFSGFLHELLHILFDYNEINLPPDFEEVLIDLFVPNGLLDVKLGFKLYEQIKNKLLSIPEKESEKYQKYKKYYDCLLKILVNYNFSKNVWEYILENVKDEKIKEIAKEVLEKLS